MQGKGTGQAAYPYSPCVVRPSPKLPFISVGPRAAFKARETKPSPTTAKDGNTSMTIGVFETGEIWVRDLRMTSRDVAGYLGELGDDEREAAFIDAVEVGSNCLQRVRAGRDMEFVR